jgi:hypothetical protein
VLGESLGGTEESNHIPDMQVTSLHTALPARPHAGASVRQELAARELAAPGSRARSGCEASWNGTGKFPRYLLITGAVVEPLDHVAE